MLIQAACGTQSERELWERIERHDFEPDHPLNFTKRLARDRDWTLQEARAAIGGYRRFCFLAGVSSSQVTPSEAVDEVWHQHLIYSRDYWDVWCGQVLKFPLHHDPTPGGPEAQRRYRQQYAETLALHERYFGAPDPDLWPGTNDRFGRRPRYRTVDTARSIVLPRLGYRLRLLFRTRAEAM
jgi:hypothetical protein